MFFTGSCFLLVRKEWFQTAQLQEASPGGRSDSYSIKNRNEISFYFAPMLKYMGKKAVNASCFFAHLCEFSKATEIIAQMCIVSKVSCYSVGHHL